MAGAAPFLFSGLERGLSVLWLDKILKGRSPAVEGGARKHGENWQSQESFGNGALVDGARVSRWMATLRAHGCCKQRLPSSADQPAA